MDIRFAIVTCSTTRGIEQDRAGARLEELIAGQGWTNVSRVVVKDDVDQIADAIVAACDKGVDVVLTCGGSGLSLADVTPEATPCATASASSAVPSSSQRMNCGFMQRSAIEIPSALVQRV